MGLRQSNNGERTRLVSGVSESDKRKPLATIIQEADQALCGHASKKLMIFPLKFQESHGVFYDDLFFLLAEVKKNSEQLDRRTFVDGYTALNNSDLDEEALLHREVDYETLQSIASYIEENGYTWKEYIEYQISTLKKSERQYAFPPSLFYCLSLKLGFLVSTALFAAEGWVLSQVYFLSQKLERQANNHWIASHDVDTLSNDQTLECHNQSTVLRYFATPALFNHSVCGPPLSLQHYNFSTVCGIYSVPVGIYAESKKMTVLEIMVLAVAILPVASMFIGRFLGNGARENLRGEVSRVLESCACSKLIASYTLTVLSVCSAAFSMIMLGLMLFPHDNQLKADVSEICGRVGQTVLLDGVQVSGQGYVNGTWYPSATDADFLDWKEDALAVGLYLLAILTAYAAGRVAQIYSASWVGFVEAIDRIKFEKVSSLPRSREALFSAVSSREVVVVSDGGAMRLEIL